MTIRPTISSTTVQNENFVEGASDMRHFLVERFRDDERAVERVEDRPLDRAADRPDAERVEADRAEAARRPVDRELDDLRPADDPALLDFDVARDEVLRAPPFAADEVFRPEVREELRDVPVRRLFCRPCAVRRATSLLKLLLPPRASVSCTSSARLFSSKEANQSSQEMGWSLPAPL